MNVEENKGQKKKKVEKKKKKKKEYLPVTEVKPRIYELSSSWENCTWKVFWLDVVKKEDFITVILNVFWTAITFLWQMHAD